MSSKSSDLLAALFGSDISSGSPDQTHRQGSKTSGSLDLQALGITLDSAAEKKRKGHSVKSAKEERPVEGTPQPRVPKIDRKSEAGLEPTPKSSVSLVKAQRTTKATKAAGGEVKATEGSVLSKDGSNSYRPPFRTGTSDIWKRSSSKPDSSSEKPRGVSKYSPPPSRYTTEEAEGSKDATRSTVLLRARNFLSLKSMRGDQGRQLVQALVETLESAMKDEKKADLEMRDKDEQIDTLMTANEALRGEVGGRRKEVATLKEEIEGLKSHVMRKADEAGQGKETKNVQLDISSTLVEQVARALPGELPSFPEKKTDQKKCFWLQLACEKLLEERVAWREYGGILREMAKADVVLENEDPPSALRFLNSILLNLREEHEATKSKLDMMQRLYTLSTDKTQGERQRLAMASLYERLDEQSRLCYALMAQLVLARQSSGQTDQEVDCSASPELSTTAERERSLQLRALLEDSLAEKSDLKSALEAAKDAYSSVCRQLERVCACTSVAVSAQLSLAAGMARKQTGRTRLAQEETYRETKRITDTLQAQVRQALKLAEAASGCTSSPGLCLRESRSLGPDMGLPVEVGRQLKQRRGMASTTKDSTLDLQECFDGYSVHAPQHGKTYMGQLETTHYQRRADSVMLGLWKTRRGTKKTDLQVSGLLDEKPWTRVNQYFEASEVSNIS